MRAYNTKSRFMIVITNLFPSRYTSTSRKDNFPFFFSFKRKFQVGMTLFK